MTIVIVVWNVHKMVSIKSVSIVPQNFLFLWKGKLWLNQKYLEWFLLWNNCWLITQRGNKLFFFSITKISHKFVFELYVQGHFENNYVTSSNKLTIFNFATLIFSINLKKLVIQDFNLLFPDLQMSFTEFFSLTKPSLSAERPWKKIK